MAKSQKSKKEDTKLKLSDIKKVSKKMEETDEYTFKDGEYKGKTIEYYPSFDQLKIEELLLEFARLMEESDELKLELSNQMQIYIVELLIIKHFTHFKKEMPDTLIGVSKQAGLLDYLTHFRKTGLYNECLDEMFSHVEINKVFDKLTDKAGLGLMAMDIDEQITQKFQKLKFQNADIFKKIDSFDGNSD